MKFGTVTRVDFLVVTTVKMSNLKIKMADERHSVNRKIAISRQQFDRLAWNLVRWCTLTLLTIPKEAAIF